MQTSEIPLSPDNQQFTTTINGINYSILTLWRDEAGWVIDLLNSSSIAIVTGIPLVTGANLLEQFGFLRLGFGLVVVCDDPAQGYPTRDDLGLRSHLLAVTE
ncbi:phage baseplate plug family protein [Pantoea agglomerans]|uniref:phage baseplate plug family protein n=1 Tax=Enterobacter agglomerans TaxID=549 RepID=UPI00045CCEDC|nr:hypothetical protein [Pantoea agglomerans]KDA93341.1 hypothetical protein T296_16805 [Pantoea agglomerans Eh318]MDK4216361.1 hypothetical protein [Pantoea agglomerans]WNK39124.1 hypothetical protein RM160_15130 [Pantoea agglomerans]WNK50286.1 hypothetical protein RM153_08105 [Pantoea agglomerans]